MMILTTKRDKKLSVLIVDDEQGIRSVIKEILESMYLFAFVVEAENGADAYQRCLRQSFDLVITDVKMPKIGGLEFIQNLVHLNKKTTDSEQSSILILTGNLTSEGVKEALGLGVKHIVMKPCDFENFTEKVQQILLKERKDKVMVVKAA